jgi:hypothetical protein
MMLSERPLTIGRGGFLDDHGHILISGASGYGKSFFLKQIGRARLRDPRFGVHLIDPDGEVAQDLFEYAANPGNGLAWRRIHLLQAGSLTETFALSLLHVPEITPQHCSEAAIRTRTIFEQVLNFGTGDYGPRLSKLLQLGCFGLALLGRPLVDLPELFTLGAARLRELIGESYPYQFMTEEWRALDVLSERNPSRFLEYTESITSRLMPTFGNPRMRRIFGQPKGLDFAHMFSAREAALLDLSDLEHKEAVLVGTSYISLFFHEALKRTPSTAPRVFFAIDEVFDYMTPDLARSFDRLRKRNIQLCVALQRLGQLEKDEDKVGIRNAVITNTALRICFGGLEPDDAEYMARLLFTGHFDLSKYKDGTERPVATRSDKTIVGNWSRAEMDAESEMTSQGTARSRGTTTGSMTAEGTGSGTAYGAVESSGEVLTPPIALFGPNGPNATMLPTPMSISTGKSASESSSNQSSRSSGTSLAESAMTSDVEMHAHGISRATSQSVGASEAFITHYEWLPTALYTLTEHLHMATGLLMNLAPREVVVKVRGAPPFRARTTNLPPAFRSTHFKRLMLPRYRATSLARSPYILPAQLVDAQIAARLDAVINPQLQPEREPDFAEREAMPVIDAPVQYANDYVQRRSPSKRKSKRPTLRVVKDGDKSAND